MIGQYVGPSQHLLDEHLLRFAPTYAPKTVGSGRQLPSQSQLTEQYGAPRYAVRRAVDRLREEKLIESWQGRSAYVRSQPLIYEINERTKFGPDVRQSGRHVQVKILSLRPALCFDVHQVVLSEHAIEAELSSDNSKQKSYLRAVVPVQGHAELL